MTATLKDQCPGLLALLNRFLVVEQVALISADYAVAAAADGNREAYIEREDGVSYKPRIARLLSILIKDFGCRDVTTLRAAVYASAVDEIKSFEPELMEVQELVTEVRQWRSGSSGSEAAGAIVATLELDAIRHLHMTTLPLEERCTRLAKALIVADGLDLLKAVSPLRKKLLHAIRLQEAQLRQHDGIGRER